MVEWKKLGEVCSEVIVPMRDRPKVFDGSIPWCRIEDIEGMYFNKSLSGLMVSESVIKAMNLKVYPTGTVICSCSATLGVCAINTQPLITNQTFIGLVCSEHINNRFLYYYMSTRKKELLSLSTTGTIPYVSREKFEKMVVPVPSLSKQQRIVGILDTFTSSIENLKEQIAQRRKQYEYYRDQLLDLEGKEGVEMKTLGEVCEISGDYGLSAPSKPYDGVRYLRITDITDSGGLNNEYVSADLKEDAGKEPLVDGDILFARTGATVGKTLVYRSNFGKCLFAGYLIRYRVRKQVVFPQYLFHFTHSTKYYNWVSASLAVGAQPNISAQRYNQLQFPLPSLSEQQRIVSILDTFEASVRNLEQQLAQREKQYEYYRNKLLTFE